MLFVTETPVDFAPAYKPVQWGFTSAKFPVNTTPGESNLPIFSIATADATAVAAIGNGLAIGDTYVVLAAPAPVIVDGCKVSIQNTPQLPYNGEWRVLRAVAPGIFTIDCPDFGGSVGGTVTYVYERYRLQISVHFATEAQPTIHYIDPSPDGVFRIDVRDQAQRAFRDVFDIAHPSRAAGIYPADQYITNLCEVIAQEGFVVYQNGIGVWQVQKERTTATPGKGQRVVNSVQPYHHINEWTGSPDHDWDENLVDYVITPTSTGARAKRLLTYAPSWDGRLRGQEVRPGDDHYLAFLCDGTGPLTVEFAFYGPNNAFISIQQFPATFPQNSGIIPCGPNNVNVPAGTETYRVALRNQQNAVVSLTYLFKMDYKCYKAPRRFYALNKFGAVDAFTFTGYENRENAYEVQMVMKPTMPAKVGPRGNWQRRTWKSQPGRAYSISSEALPKAWLRYVADEIMESPDIRTIIQRPDIIGPDVYPWWTYVINLTESAPLGFEHGRLRFAYALGVDNEVQRR